jgi:hypothetical protein
MELIDFVEKFFINLKAQVLKQGGILKVSNVPFSFEKFYGKKSPYEFVFRAEDKNPENELIKNGSFLLKTISNFLDNSRKTTLLKINFDFNPDSFHEKIKLNNCIIEKLSPKKKYNFFFRFTFHTSFRYLNEKEKMINEIYVFDNKVINGDLSNYKVIEGNSKEVILPNIKTPYELAKEKLKELNKLKISLISEELEKKLSKEIERIESHFGKENQELIKKNPEENILREKSEAFKKDKAREIEIEKQRHSLNLGIKLFNTTLIYYPIFTYDCFLSNKENKRIIEISFDPLLKEMNKLFCESCKEKTDEIYFCSSGHISCKKCFSECSFCKKNYCKKCMNIICEECGEKICKNCSIRCFNCGRILCKKHSIKDNLSGRYFCNRCLKICERCGKKKEPLNFKISKRTGADICEDCFRKEMQDNVKERLRED